MKRVSFWIKNSRYVSLPQSLMPALVAVSLSIQKEKFNIILAILAIIGVCIAHLSLNLFDDYFDYRKKETGFRNSLAREGIRARTQKCPYLTSGEATTKQLLRAALIFGLVACVPGIIILITRGYPILWIVLITVVLGISYSSDPLRLSYRGVGELVIGIIFGPLLVIGVSYASSAQANITIIAMGICMGLLVTNILYTHSILDYEADLRSGKSTLAGLIKSNYIKLIVSAIFNFLPYVLVIVCVIVKIFEPAYLLMIVTLPWAVKLFSSLRIYTKNPNETVERAFWHGPMGHWEAICNMEISWFMFRWYMARNMLTAFALICIIASIVTAFL